MAKQTVVIQLVVDGRMIWQVKQDVVREICRRMTDRELKELGKEVASDLADITRGVEADPMLDEIASHAIPAKKKR